MSKNRSPRLLKKLKLGEFQEFGFHYSAEFKKPLDQDAQEDLIDAFLAEAIEARGLVLGGWMDAGFVVKYRSGSATEEDRQAVEAWLKACDALQNVEVGALVDAWYE
jgi:uncharacterized protein